MKRPGNLKAIKEIAFEIGRSQWWVSAVKREMERSGINWTANMITIDALLAWVRANNFRSTRSFRRNKGSRVQSL